MSVMLQGLISQECSISFSLGNILRAALSALSARQSKVTSSVQACVSEYHMPLQKLFAPAHSWKRTASACFFIAVRNASRLKNLPAVYLCGQLLRPYICLQVSPYTHVCLYFWYAPALLAKSEILKKEHDPITTACYPSAPSPIQLLFTPQLMQQTIILSSDTQLTCANIPALRVRSEIY